MQTFDTKLLKDIYLPSFALAWGWYIVISLAFLCCLLLVMCYVQRRNKNTYRRVALAELTKHKPHLQSNKRSVVNINHILKFTALKAYHLSLLNKKNQQQEALLNPSSLAGKQWVDFLDRHCFRKDNSFATSVGYMLEDNLYKQNSSTNIEDIHHLFN